MKFHGKYCGPNWSDGKVQSSVVGKQPPDDELDRACQEHDGVYAVVSDMNVPKDLKNLIREQADSELITKAANLYSKKANIKAGLVAVAVKGQKALGRYDKYNPMSFNHKLDNKFQPFSKPSCSADTMPKTNLKPTPTSTKAITAAIKQAAVMTPSNGMNNSTVPVANAFRYKAKAPKMKGKGDTITLSHTGLLGTLHGNATYGVESWYVNPGLIDTFPWGSRVAKSFDKYKFTHLSFEYRALASTAVSGVVTMSFDFDALDSDPLSKYEQSQTVPRVENQAYVSNVLNIKCDNLWRFTRQGTVSSSDLKTYDFGKFLISSYGSSTTSPIGEIFVNYTVELKYPTLAVSPSTRVICTSLGATVMFHSTAYLHYGTVKLFDRLTDLSITLLGTGDFSFTLFQSGAGAATLPDPTIAGAIGSAVELRSTTTTPTGQTWAKNYRIRCFAGDVLSFANGHASLSKIEYYMVPAEWNSL